MEGNKATVLVSSPPRNEELEFLPAALEVQETPPSPVGRAIAAGIGLLFLIAVVWSYFGHIDIVATAAGKIVPSGQVKIIQPMAQATVRAIRVREGQHVAAGEVLVEFDPTISAAERNRLREQLAAARLDRARLVAMLTVTERATPAEALATAWPTGADPAAITTHRRLMHSALAEQRASLAALQAELARARAERQSTERDKRRLESILPLIAQRAHALEVLARRKMAPKLDYLQIEQQRLDHAGHIRTIAARLQALDARIEEDRRRIEVQRAQFQKDLAQRLLESEKQIASLQEELRKADARTGWNTLDAPIAGFVQGLKIHTTGGVVQPAEELMRIVPENAPLEVQAWLANRDVGFVNTGQLAEVKVETFPFTRYGTLHAEVTQVSNDAVQDEHRGLVYQTTARIDRAWMNVNGRRVHLSPGMTVSLEVKTGRRRVLDFLLAPLIEHIDESARER
ncbi:HlyD family type I secretion periplasmic adaptor subunit [Nitrococcus mobilis]|uniref:Membrane fusion protein (MFP) family protein n=1 Tax=Nitrococcus mobilis Nb-231 TaxID=314278 RepID=A4BV66_9GAMM|nr:HlyD family type I secretion periplasmic adaptor subunit [Nitrococcus mobilis]EAR20408.1 Membrane-fusion protein [Nitrococcus mobilis Nb-231]